MLKLLNIVKNYQTKEDTVKVLKDVSICFRRCEFVSVFGPSGCGKTTLLNIIGGLDNYTSGDIVIDGVSTKKYGDVDWDTYRNCRIGFVFQSYNLIPHMSVLKNVEIPLTLAGVPKGQRREAAMEALAAVGLESQARKKPNQLSGGQMQRVAIARALVNNPDIILADEPTGALDSESGVMVAELLKEVAQDRLVIMVTHNPTLAEQYSTRIVNLKDGEVVGDSNPYTPEMCGADEEARAELEKKTEAAFEQRDSEGEKEGKQKSRRPKKRSQNKTSMSFGTAISLSYSNLLSKKGRTFLTSLAGSIGIIGIILVLGLSSGAKGYIKSIEENALSQYPLEIARTNTNLSAVLSLLSQQDDSKQEYPDSDVIETNKVIGNLLDNLSSIMQPNDLKSLKVYLEENFDESIGYVKYDYGTTFDVYCNYVGDEDKYMKVNPFIEGIEDVLPPAFSGMLDFIKQFANMLSVWDEMIDNEAMLQNQYELLGDSKWPTRYDEVVIVVDEKNRLDDYTLFALGLKSPQEVYDALVNGNSFTAASYTVDELLNLEYKIMTKSDYYYQEDGVWKAVSDRNSQRDKEFVDANGLTVKVTGVVRPRQGAAVTSINGSIGYTPELTEYLTARAENSPAVKAQQASPDVDILTGNIINEDEYDQLMLDMGVADLANPMVIKIYANSFDDKEKIVAFLNEYNETREDDIKYSDQLAMIMGYVDTLTTTVTGVLVGFSAISLIVSSIMIAIIIYTSVLERRKEIGVLRSVGARKKDISNVFIAESGMIGLVSGLIGIIISYILFMPVNLVLAKFLGVAGLVTIQWWQPIMMIGISFVLAVVAGFIPSRIAAKKDPVECLRTD